MKQFKKLNSRGDWTLAIGAIVLWSLGRVINPLVHLELDNNGTLDPVLSFAEIVYVTIHAVLFCYALVLLSSAIRRNGWNPRGRALGEVLLYLYVIVTIAISLYFIAYQFGYLPPVLIDWFIPTLSNLNT